MFSCRTRGFCPSCHAKRVEEWGEWIRETLIPDKSQVTVRYYGLDANAHRGKVRKASLGLSPLRIVEEELRRLPSKGWAALIRKPH